MDTLLQVEREAMDIGRNKLLEIFTVRRNRNAALASEIVMFFQQFCGVNTIAYYSTEMFIQSGFAEQPALAASLGFGVINWLFAIPGMYTIDTFGRRKLLLTTFPVTCPPPPATLLLCGCQKENPDRAPVGLTYFLVTNS